MMKIVATPHHRRHDPSTAIVDNVPFITEDIPARAEVLLAGLLAAGLGTLCEPNDYGLEPILAVHAPDLVAYLQEIWDESFSTQPPGSLPETHAVVPYTFATRGIRHFSPHVDGRPGYYCFGVGTPVLQHTWQAAYWSAQCALTAADYLCSGALSVYALCRPPGHHAARDLYGGYCYLNNAAIAARYLGSRCLGGRTAILDIDYHHGNGTQEIFYSDPDVLTCSLHADPDQDYPYYWGSREERGSGRGEGCNRNWPLPRGTQDQAYLVALWEALQAIAEFQPAALILSAGLDIGLGDPAGGFEISRAGFEQIGAAIASLNLPTLIVQEGSYRLDTLGENGAALLASFSQAE